MCGTLSGHRAFPTPHSKKVLVCEEGGFSLQEDGPGRFTGQQMNTVHSPAGVYKGWRWFEALNLNMNAGPDVTGRGYDQH